LDEISPSRGALLLWLLWSHVPSCSSFLSPFSAIRLLSFWDICRGKEKRGKYGGGISGRKGLAYLMSIILVVFLALLLLGFLILSVMRMSDEHSLFDRQYEGEDL